MSPVKKRIREKKRERKLPESAVSLKAGGGGSASQQSFFHTEPIQKGAVARGVILQWSLFVFKREENKEVFYLIKRYFSYMIHFLKGNL